MTAAAWDAPGVALGMTILTGVASGLVPFVSAELLVVTLGTLAPRPLLPLLLVVATLSHMVGKALLYLAGRATERLPEGAFKRRLRAARAKLGGRSELGAVLVFVSAVTGIPPFYAVTVVSGVVGYDFRLFFLIGFAGRLVRFAALLAAPQLARALLS